MTITRSCKDCGQDFDITDKDQEFLNKQGWPLYVRCLPCRRLKKATGYQKPYAKP